ncbi:5-oxoprolinase/urea amidolyase family protein [Schumannella sp. 10F1B-5-1]|uniref:5-oxoprolinase subunit B/C family protein n=1 Tax=Schumannella sp. 10F1B-5-1 TaxID=2590780 RepID=UPI0015E87021|nr:5-oxoprolinase/urea amidolyase family protein [Schumannella sp. 10F1B-5-1]
MPNPLRLLRAGERGVLIETEAARTHDVVRLLSSSPWDALLESTVPTRATVLAVLRRSEDVPALVAFLASSSASASAPVSADAIRELPSSAGFDGANPTEMGNSRPTSSTGSGDSALGGSAASTEPLPREIEVVYDGPDLDAVAELSGLPRDEVIAAHSGAEHRVGWFGFAPGFAYLDTDYPDSAAPALALPRRASPRVRIDAGSVAIAGGQTVIYPGGTPGGWHLIGRTDARLWDLERDPPALLDVGERVRFVPVERLTDHLQRAEATPPDARDSSGPELRILAARPGATVQDGGRTGWTRFGVTVSGPADRAAFDLANRLVGNPAGTAAIEVTLGGLAAVADAGADAGRWMSLTGAPAPVTLDDHPVADTALFWVPAGARLELGTPPIGVRSYLAVAGGVVTARVLGSMSTDTLAGLGPAPLAAGASLALGDPSGVDPDSPAASSASAADSAAAAAGTASIATAADSAGAARRIPVGPTTVRFTWGPRDALLTPHDRATLTASTWRVSAQADRVGVRLEGAIVGSASGDLPSEGIAEGAIQLPPSGEPIVFLADHPVTGGYPVVGVVVAADLGLLAQARPGVEVRLRPVGGAGLLHDGMRVAC